MNIPAKQYFIHFSSAVQTNAKGITVPQKCTVKESGEMTSQVVGTAGVTPIFFPSFTKKYAERRN